ncbi:MAG: NADPH:quinone oxidoreductase family protein [Pseudomonadales bacterium]|nr:NADPH:quinone oxidoreductase family protein [Pseudomonadales bacterium]
MRAIICTKFDSPKKLKISEAEDPIPGDKEVLISIKAVGLGYVDALTVAGLYQIKPSLPFIPGNEVAGIVEKTGDEVKHLRVGQRVIATPSQGGLAEKVCISQNKCTVIPQNMDYAAAASFQVNYCTAYHGLNYCGNLKPKEIVLVLGAAGGVGIAAIEIAKAMGATVIAAASTKKKRDAAIKWGADFAIDYTIENWRDKLKKVLDGRPLDMVYDPVGGKYSEPALRSLSPDGRFLVVGFASGDIAKVPLNLVLLKRCKIVGVNWGAFIAANPTQAKPVLTRLLEWIASKKLTPSAGECYPMEKTGTAMMKMLNRKAIGKLVITMDVE